MSKKPEKKIREIKKDLLSGKDKQNPYDETFDFQVPPEMTFEQMMLLIANGTGVEEMRKEESLSNNKKKK